ncbi:MAG: imidazole glycerol phosphate synthase subunit HisH [Mangrovibacterium sp.]
MKVVIIKYNAGNVESVSNALKRLGVEPLITANHAEIQSADKVIFPGVGEAKNTMAYLEKEGLDVLIPSLRQPVLGICLGLQLMCSHSEEGDVRCLGIFNEQVKQFCPTLGREYTDKVPHMGWNTIADVQQPLFDKCLEGEYVYFVHSYYATIGEHTAATGNYINKFSAALHKDNFYATQFHPEKSGDVGEQILSNFLKL